MAGDAGLWFAAAADDCFLQRPAPPRALPEPDLAGEFWMRVPRDDRLFALQWRFEGARGFAYRRDRPDALGSMDLTNAYVEATGPLLRGGRTFHGLRFRKLTAFEELFAADSRLAEALLFHLRRFCVRQDFDRQYELLEQIGEGSFGRVFAARRRADGSRLAVKAYEKAGLVGRGALAVKSELRVLRRLDDPRVLRFIELFESPELLLCVTELYNGPSLAKALPAGSPLPEPAALLLLRELLRGLAYLHAQGIVHRDVKPDNVLFKRSADFHELVLVDFGFATELDAPPLLRRCGSLGYVAPEVLNDGPVTARADAFSAGAVLFRLLSGELAFPGEVAEEVLQANARGAVELERAGDVSPQTRDLLRRLLTADPQQRLDCAEALQHPCFAALRGRAAALSLAGVTGYKL